MHDERLQQDISTMEKLYGGKWNLNTIITATSMQEKLQINIEGSQMGKEF